MEIAAWSQEEAYLRLYARCHDRIIAEGRLADVPPDEREQAIDMLVSQFLYEMRVQLGRAERDRLVREITWDLLSYGPITPLLQDETISEVMVNGPRQVYVERDGRLELTGVRFRDEEHLRLVIDRIVSGLGRRIDESSPMVDARLPDGSRVNAIIPPVSLVGPVLTVRKFVRSRLTAEELVRIGSITTSMVELLRLCVVGKLNILVSGGTGTGKTTVLNLLSSFIPHDERLISIEDTAELQLRHPHWIRLETRPPNVEGRGEVTARDLLRNALRMRPDRIIIGEVRGAEAFEMVQAMNTGHEGGMSTLHANTTQDAVSKLASYMRYAGLVHDTDVINAQIASAIHLLVHVHRFQDGSRKVVAISEVTGLEGTQVAVRDIWRFRREPSQDGSVRGRFELCCPGPRVAEVLAERGVVVPAELLRPGQTEAD